MDSTIPDIKRISDSEEKMDAQHKNYINEENEEWKWQCREHHLTIGFNKTKEYH